MDSNNTFELKVCPFCGMEGGLGLFQTIGEPSKFCCKHCYKSLYDLKIIKIHFDPMNMAKNILKSNIELREEMLHKKEVEEIKVLKDKQKEDLLIMSEKKKV